MLSTFCPIKSKKDLLQIVVLLGAGFLAFSIRLFSISRFDLTLAGSEPFFNYRVTNKILKNGIFNHLNWFDEKSWHPMGRLVGETIYPGLTFTAAILHRVINFGFTTTTVQETCIYFGPIMASLTSISIYFLTSELTSNFGASLISTIFMATIPGFISTSVAGKFGSESLIALAIIILLTFWIKSVKTGSIFWSVLTAAAAFFAAATWEDSALISVLIPAYVIVMLFLGKFSAKLYVAFSTYYLLGSLLMMQVTPVGFDPISNAKFILPLFTFVYVQFYSISDGLKTKLSPPHFKLVNQMVSTAFTCTIAIILMAVQFGRIGPLDEQYRVMLNPNRAKYNRPVLASASENQPSAWAALFFDSHFGMLFMPVGVYLILKQTSESTLLLIVYAVISVYYAAVKIRLLVVLSPCISVLSAVAVSHFLNLFIAGLTAEEPVDEKVSKKQREKLKTEKETFPLKRVISGCMLGVLSVYCAYSLKHAIWTASSAYSDPGIMLSATKKDGGKFFFDDFRESYSWISQNTPPDSKFLSWWDYGYQIGTMGDRTTIVDNFTQNNTQIGKVGLIFAGSEEESYRHLIEIDADYVLVTFGGMVSWAKDDINKFLWMLRIAKTIPDGAHLSEKDYKNINGEFRMDLEGASKWLNSVLYKLSYYRYGSMRVDSSRPDGWDRVRNAEIGNKDFELETMEEVYTSSHWLVRIYRVIKPDEQSVSWF